MEKIRRVFLWTFYSNPTIHSSWTWSIADCYEASRFLLTTAEKKMATLFIPCASLPNRNKPRDNCEWSVNGGGKLRQCAALNPIFRCSVNFFSQLPFFFFFRWSENRAIIVPWAAMCAHKCVDAHACAPLSLWLQVLCAFAVIVGECELAHVGMVFFGVAAVTSGTSIACRQDFTIYVVNKL